MDYLSSLNQGQRAAVEHISGPLLIVAGAGTGKTKTLTTRIWHLIQSGVTPSNILAITFTNKAAGENSMTSTRWTSNVQRDVQRPCSTSQVEHG